MSEWISVDDRLPDDKVEKFTGGPEGSWGVGVLIVTKCHPQKGIRRLFGYFDEDGFYSVGEKIEAAHWMVAPPEPI